MEAPTGPEGEVELVGLGGEALAAPGLEAELAAPEEEVAAPTGPEGKVKPVGLGVEVLAAPGLEVKLAAPEEEVEAPTGPEVGGSRR